LICGHLVFFDTRYCREDRIRTCDPLVPNQVRYRPALLPDSIWAANIQPFNLKPADFINLNEKPSYAKASEGKAERVGFEPTVQYDPYDDLANRSFRPLRHLSVFFFPKDCSSITIYQTPPFVRRSAESLFKISP
jgi:hypothetical protein